MAAEYVVAGRRELPGGTNFGEPWYYVLNNEEGSLEVYQAAQRNEAELIDQADKILGWKPKSIVFVRKAWELAEVVAEELAIALEGAVFCDVACEVSFDAFEKAKPAASLPELEERLKSAFNNPGPFFEQREKESREEWKILLATDPTVIRANDWSEVMPEDPDDPVFPQPPSEGRVSRWIQSAVQRLRGLSR